MLTRRGRLATVAALAALAVASCSSDKQEVVPTTTTTTPPPVTRTTTATAPSAPAVANPLDASDFVARPCTSLTKAQQRQYGITRTERTTLAAAEGESCFFYRTGADRFWVVFSSRISNGLSYRYIEHDRGSWGYWKPTDLDGYPAVAFGNTDPPACFFAVGVSDSLHFWVKASPDEACTESRAVAAAILANIKAAN